MNEAKVSDWHMDEYGYMQRDFVDSVPHDVAASWRKDSVSSATVSGTGPVPIPDMDGLDDGDSPCGGVDRRRDAPDGTSRALDDVD